MLIESVTLLRHVNNSVMVLLYANTDGFSHTVCNTIGHPPTLCKYSRQISYSILIQPVSVLWYVNTVGNCPKLY
jgi:hypothetical protein